MPVSIDRSDLVRIVRAAGESGKALPEVAKGDPELEKAYVDGGGTLPPGEQTADPAPASTPNTPAGSGDRSEPGPGTPPPTPPAPSLTKGPASGSKFGAAASRSGRRVGTRALTRAPSLPKAASAGGIALALWIYPPVVAVLMHGPAGAGDWFKAKFLNDTTGSSSKSGVTGIPDNGPNAPGVQTPTTTTPSAVPAPKGAR